MQENHLIRLASGRLELILSPRVGGSVARFDFLVDEGKLPIFRGSEGGPEKVLETGCFPLVPFCNRIRDGQFQFRHREIFMAPNMKGDPSPLHGHGWLAPWAIERVEEGEAELHFRHEPGEWPWSYEARQSFRLDADGLTIQLACRNLADEPMPCGLGQHPYYPCTADTRLDTRVSHAWTIDEKILPVDKVPATGRYNLQDRLVCGQDLDNGWGGWGGMARMHTPGQPFAIEMSSPDAEFFQLYSPRAGGLYVAEPVTHANAALNEPEDRWPELSLRVLSPGEEMSLTSRFEVRPVA